MARVKISPSKARELLAVNTRNRPIRAADVTRFSRDMRNGFWRYSADPILMFRRDSESDRLVNGQHRLIAVTVADVPCEFEFKTTDDESAFEVIDSGRARTHADFLRGRGVENPSRLSAAARLMWRLDEFQGGPRVPPSYTDLDMLIGETQGGLAAAVERTIDRRRKVPLNALNAAVMGVSDYLFTSQDAEDGYQFWINLISPNSLKEMDPIRQLNGSLETERMNSKKKRTPKAQLAYTIKAWNQWRNGDDETRLVYKSNDRYPTV